jgi:hypothetical protein
MRVPFSFTRFGEAKLALKWFGPMLGPPFTAVENSEKLFLQLYVPQAADVSDVKVRTLYGASAGSTPINFSAAGLSND